MKTPCYTNRRSHLGFHFNSRLLKTDGQNQFKMMMTKICSENHKIVRVQKNCQISRSETGYRQILKIHIQSQSSWLDSCFMTLNIPMFSPQIFVLIILTCSSNQGSVSLFELSISFSKWNLLVIPPNNYHRWYQFVSGTWASLTAAAISSAQYRGFYFFFRSCFFNLVCLISWDDLSSL